MPQGYELAMQPTDGHEDDDDYSEDSSEILSLVQARLKRKKFRGILLGSGICVIFSFLIGAGVGCGVAFTGNNDHHGQTKTVAAATDHSTSKNSYSAITSSEIISTVSPTHLAAFTAAKDSSAPVITTVTTTNTFVPTSKFHLVTSTASSTHSIHSVLTATPSSTHSTHTVSTTTVATTNSSPAHSTHTVSTTTANSSPAHSTHTVSTARVTTITSSPAHSIHTVSTAKVTTTTSSPAPRITMVTPSPTPRIVQPNIVNSDILSYINTEYDPCEDFYQYSCGHWYNSHYRAKHWGTASELALSNYHKIAGYLSSYISSVRDLSALRKAKYIYSACTNTDYIQDHLLTKIKDFMRYKAGGWENAGFYPVRTWSINNNIYKDHYLGSTAFFQFGITPDDLNSSLPVIRVSNGVCKQAFINACLPL